MNLHFKNKAANKRGKAISITLLFFLFSASAAVSFLRVNNIENSEIEFYSTMDTNNSPFLFFNDEDISKFQENIKEGWMKDAFLVLKRRVDGYNDNNFLPVPRGQVAGRTLHKIVSDYAWVGLMTKEESYLTRAKNILLSNAQAYTATDYNQMHGHLSMGDAAHAYAAGYDWLAPYMTPEERQIILERVEDMGAACYNHSMTNSNYGSPNPPPAGCNHNPVVNSSMGLCALVLGNKPEWLELAIRQTRAYFRHSLDPTGYSYEGLSYFAYGSLGSTAFSNALYRQGGPDLIMELDKIGLSVTSIVRHVLPQGDGIITIGDSHQYIKPAGGFMYIVSRYQNKMGLWTWLQLMGKEGDGTFGNDYNYVGASLPYALMWADPDLKPETPAEAELSHNLFFESGRGFFRDGWGKLNSLAVFTSGYTTHRGHNQRDENTFSFYARGEAFIIDPGYTPNNTIDHSGVLVDGVGQERPDNVYDIYGRVIDYKEMDNAVWIKGDATATYPKHLGIKRITRQMLFVNGETKGAPQPYIIIIDDITKTDNSISNYSLLFQTHPKNSIHVNQESETATIIGNKRKSELDLKVLYPDNTTLNVPELKGVIRKGVRDANFTVLNNYRTLEVLLSGNEVRIITFLVAKDNGEPSPIVTQKGSPGNMEVTVSFSNGDVDTWFINLESVSQKKTEATKTFSSIAYFVNHQNQTVSAGIAPMNQDIPVDLFLSYMEPETGISLELVDKNGSTKTYGTLAEGDKLKVILNLDNSVLYYYDLIFGAVSTQTISDNSRIKITPTSQKSVLKISGAENGDIVAIYNSAGSLILKKHLSGIEENIQIENYTKGIYIVSVINGSKLLYHTKVNL